MSVVVVIPSRGRPERARSAVQAVRDTAVRIDTSVIVAIDADDPARAGYDFHFAGLGPEVTLVTLDADETGDLVRATNTVSMRVARADPDAIIGNLGDDQIGRTHGWDRMVVEAMSEPGLVYGNDLFQGEALQCGGTFIHAVIVNALGWFALPTCEHLFIDNAWGDIGRGLGLMTYLPDMIFEHVHPFAGKAEWDEGYERANNALVDRHDKRAYEVWKSTWLAADLQNIRSALNVEAGKRARYPVTVE